MSDAAAGPTDRRQDRAAPRTSRSIGHAALLGRLRTAIAPALDPGARQAAFEAIETHLSGLSSAALDDLRADPGYREIRGDLIRIRANLWYEHELDIAQTLLSLGDGGSMSALFEHHIPRDAYADELAAIAPFELRSLLIVGSGPCPATAIVLTERFPACRIVGLDRSDRACALSRELLRRAGCANVTIIQARVEDVDRFDDFDSILLTLNVGETDREKTEIVRYLKTRADPQAVLLARTAFGWSRILYPTIQLPGLNPETNAALIPSKDVRAVIVPIRFKALPDWPASPASAEMHGQCRPSPSTP